MNMPCKSQRLMLFYIVLSDGQLGIAGDARTGSAVTATGGRERRPVTRSMPCNRVTLFELVAQSVLLAAGIKTAHQAQINQLVPRPTPGSRCLGSWAGWLEMRR